MAIPSAFMADSVKPALIPAKFKLGRNGVLAYIDGEYAWTEDEIHSFPRFWCITVTGNPAVARDARCIDVERYDATPDDVPPYRDARTALGGFTYVYSDRNTLPDIYDACGSWNMLHLFVATLDFNPWTPQTLAANIRAETGLIVPPDIIVAIQNIPGENYDQSSIFGNPDWTHTRDRTQ